MKINLLSFHGALNYGAVWQIYSLSRVLGGLGADVRLIDLRLPWDWPAPFSAKGLKEFFHPIARQRRKSFKGFITKYLPPLTRMYNAPGQLVESPPPGDIFMVGSDQVWNPEHTRQYCLDYFFYPLSIRAKKVSYAASFGSDTSVFTKTQQKNISKALQQFEHVSVRELSGIEICHTLGCKSVAHVLDPVFLPSIDEFQRICYNRLDSNISNFIVCYKFYQDKNMLECLKFISDKLSKKAFLLHVPSLKFYLKSLLDVLTKKTLEWQIEISEHPSPLEWLATLMHSSFIFTDSFHGTAFAIKFRKNFIVTVGNKRRFARIRELLKDLGLEGRIFNSYREIQDDMRWLEPIDYDRVYSLLNYRIESSKNFIKSVLQQ